MGALAMIWRSLMSADRIAVAGVEAMRCQVGVTVQGALNLFATSLRVKDLLAKNFYSVDTLDPEHEDNGYED